MDLLKIISILREHNDTGKPVLRITGGKCLEKDLLRELLDGCEGLLNQNGALKTVLKQATDDFAVIGEINAMPTPMLHPQYGEQIIDVKTKRWRFNDAALKLIAGTDDATDT